MKRTLFLLLGSFWFSGSVLAAPQPGSISLQELGYEWVPANELGTLPVWSCGVPKDLNEMPYFHPSFMWNPITAFENSAAPPKAGRMGGAWVYKNPLSPVWNGKYNGCTGVAYKGSPPKSAKASPTKPGKPGTPQPGSISLQELGYEWVPANELGTLPVWSCGVPKDLNEMPYFHPRFMWNPITAFENSAAPPKAGRMGGAWVYKNPLSPVWNGKYNGCTGVAYKGSPPKASPTKPGKQGAP